MFYFNVVNCLELVIDKAEYTTFVTITPLTLLRNVSNSPPAYLWPRFPRSTQSLGLYINTMVGDIGCAKRLIYIYILILYNIIQNMYYIINKTSF